MVWRAHSDVTAIRLFAAYVPLDTEQRRNRSFGILLVRKPKIPGLLIAGWPLIRYFVESIFAQDKIAVEAEQRAWETQGGDWNRGISPVLLELRRVLRDCGAPQKGST
jgi:renierapurpurin 18,18'-hydroxylase